MALRIDVRSRRLLLVVTSVTILGVMPVFLVGAFGSAIRAELGFDEAGLGLVVASGFASAAVASVLIGRWTETIGTRRSFLLSVSLTIGSLVGVAAFASAWSHLTVFVAIGGIANGIAQPASNLALAHGLPDRPGLMFGAKQAGAPAATLLAGAAVPVMGATLGWRWAFVGMAGLAAVVGLTLPRELPDRRSEQGRLPVYRDVSVGLLVGLAVAAGIGVSAATALASFVVGSAVTEGVSMERAGWLLSLGSGAAIMARLATGSIADRRERGRLVLVSMMLATGAAGFLLLSAGGQGLVIVGTVIAFAGGWGWTGLLMFATVRLNEGAPAAATGIVQAGAAAGAAIGPFAFGYLVVHGSYSSAWRAAAAAALVSALLILAVRTRIIADRQIR